MVDSNYGAPPTTAMIDSYAVNFKTEVGRTYATVMLVGAVCAFDFVATLISIQAFYYILEGPENLYGLAVGIYDILQLLAAPLFGIWSDRYGYKAPLCVGVLCTSAGNLLYAMLFVIHHEANASTGWPWMLVARGIMGIGSAAITCGTAFLTSHTSMTRRFEALGSYRAYQSIARMVRGRGRMKTSVT